MIGQASEWVIGARSADRRLRNKQTKEKGLAPEASATFNFVVEVKRPGGRSLQRATAPAGGVSASLKFTRIVLEGGKVADPGEVEIVK